MRAEILSIISSLSGELPHERAGALKSVRRQNSLSSEERGLLTEKIKVLVFDWDAEVRGEVAPALKYLQNYRAG